jgi:RNA polymerase sigma-70 factor, ECF subfamily
MTANAPAELSNELAAILVSRWPASTTPVDEALGARLIEAHRKSVVAWPELGLTAQRFIEYLAERLDPSRPLADAIEAAEVTDLYLACACAEGLPAAHAAFESQHLATLGPALARIDPSPAFADEVRQTLRIRLLIGDVAGDRAPAILHYRGKGPLRHWLGVVATRAALTLRGQGQPWASLDDVVLHASLDSPELHNLRSLYLDDLRQATREAVSETLAELGPEARNLLRWHLVQGVSLRKIAVARGTYVMAVARQYTRIRGAILDRIRVKARERMGLAPAEADSLVAALVSRISITISRLFEAPPGAGSPGPDGS